MFSVKKNELLISINNYIKGMQDARDFQWYQCQWKTDMSNRTL